MAVALDMPGWDKCEANILAIYELQSGEASVLCPRVSCPLHCAQAPWCCAMQACSATVTHAASTLVLQLLGMSPCQCVATGRLTDWALATLWLSPAQIVVCAAASPCL